MHLHLPKPLHGWRAFIGEVGIIVVGVLIALGAEQGVQSIHQRNEAAEARENVRAEAALDVQFIRDRLAVENCIDRRLAELATILERAGVDAMDRQPTWIARPPTAPFFARRWDTATASGRNSLFPSQEQERLGSLYDVFARFNEYETREQQVWSDLRALENWQGPLGPEARLSFAKDLQQAKYLAWDLNFAGHKALEFADRAAFSHERSTPSLASICLPIYTPRDEALRKLDSKYGFP